MWAAGKAAGKEAPGGRRGAGADPPLEAMEGVDAGVEYLPSTEAAA